MVITESSPGPFGGPVLHIVEGSGYPVRTGRRGETGSYQACGEPRRADKNESGKALSNDGRELDNLRPGAGDEGEDDQNHMLFYFVNRSFLYEKRGNNHHYGKYLYYPRFK